MKWFFDNIPSWILIIFLLGVVMMQIKDTLRIYREHPTWKQEQAVSRNWLIAWIIGFIFVVIMLINSNAILNWGSTLYACGTRTDNITELNTCMSDVFQKQYNQSH